MGVNRLPLWLRHQGCLLSRQSGCLDKGDDKRLEFCIPDQNKCVGGFTLAVHFLTRFYAHE